MGSHILVTTDNDVVPNLKCILMKDFFLLYEQFSVKFE
jgi:hypothetical protein